MYLRAKDYFSDFEKVYGASGVLPSLDGADHFRLRKSMQSAYSRGTLDRSEKREAVAASSCDGLLHVHVCGPFQLPIFRWGIDSSSSSDGPSGEVAGIEANKRRLTLDLASTLQPWLKVWRSRASACTGAVKPPSIGRPTKGEADTPFLGGAMRHSRHAPGAPTGRYAVRPRLRARGFSSRAGRQGQTRERPTTGLPSCLARTRSSRYR